MRTTVLLACIAVGAGTLAVCQWREIGPNPGIADVAPEARPHPSAPERVLVSLRFSAGKLAGPSTIKVQEGDVVGLNVTVDRTDQLHLHGYDLQLPLRAGEPARLEFIASRTGRFIYELHHAGIELGALEVHPR